MNKSFSGPNKYRFKLLASGLLIVLSIYIIPAIVTVPYFDVPIAVGAHTNLNPATELTYSGVLIYNTWLVFGIAIALTTGVLALIDHVVRKEISALIAGSVLITAGLYDLLCLALPHLLPDQQTALNPYVKWLISRCLQVALLSGSLGYFLFINKSRSAGMKFKTRGFLLSACLISLVAAVAFSFWLNQARGLQNSSHAVHHPVELIILFNYLALGLIILPRYNERFPSLFARIVLWSILPSAMADVFMRLHDKNFDIFFNAAHFFRFVSYGVPLAGITSNYIQAVVKQKAFINRLHAEINERITIQKDLEQRESSLAASGYELESKLEELKRSNSELEQFAYVASHDMQEPLRKIKAFGDMLYTRHSDNLSEQGRDYLGRIRNASERLQRLIDDLLSLSQLRKAGSGVRPIVLAEVIRGVLADLEYQIEKKNARIEVSAEINIRGIPVQIRQLFQNVIHNSLKFSNQACPPHIKIHANYVTEPRLQNRMNPGQAENKYCMIEVEDNGIGFDMEDAEKIFHLFHRLHSKSEYEGSGLGLALCKKIIDNHYGYIEAEGREGKGALIRIYLPV